MTSAVPGDAGANLSTTVPAVLVDRRHLVRIGLVLSLCALIVGSVQFARYDWTGLPLQRSAPNIDRTISPRCHEQIRPYVTSSGRTISPAAIDDQQYMSMIERFRGADHVQVECYYAPFTDRAAVPRLASLLPFDEALSLALVNTAFLLAGVWLLIATLVAQGFGVRAVVAASALAVINWVTFVFGTTLLIESAPFAAVALAWLLMSKRRWWWTAAVIVAGVLLKETVVLALPPLWVAIATDGDEPRGARRWAPAVVATLGAGVAYVGRAGFGPAPDAAWPTGVDLSLLSLNLAPTGLFVLAVALVPLLVPSALWLKRRVGEVGVVAAVWDPAVVGVLGGLALLGWIMITADLSPRFFWPCFPFAATLTARWCSSGRPAQWLKRLPMPEWLIGPPTA